MHTLSGWQIGQANRYRPQLATARQPSNKVGKYSYAQQLKAGCSWMLSCSSAPTVRNNPGIAPGAVSVHLSSGCQFASKPTLEPLLHLAAQIGKHSRSCIPQLCKTSGLLKRKQRKERPKSYL